MQTQVRQLGQQSEEQAFTRPHVVYWFRNDLRLSDNLALAQACQFALQHNASLSLIVCLPETQQSRWGFTRLDQHRKAYLAATVRELAIACARLGQQLIITEGQAATVLPSVLSSLQATCLFCEEIAAPEEIAEIAALQQSVPINGFQIQTFWQSSLLEPSSLPFSVDELPLVFSTFRNQVEKANCRPLPPLTEMTSLPAMPERARQIANVDLQSWAGRVDIDERSAFCYQHDYAKPGEQAAQQHLQHYFQSGQARSYKNTRNGLIGFAYSTKFSPWLAVGALSARQIYQQLNAHEAEHGQNDSTYWIWFELLWRDYFRFLQLRFGNTLYHRHGLKSLADTHSAGMVTHDPSRFTRWCQGNTGQPLIDAGMRELQATGYLSNRMRQIVASYLVNDLQCDWRAGAAWFESQLIDYDVYSNQGNWLYLAGVGTDPRANRRFNLEKQLQTYDPQHNYLKRWLS